MALFVPQTMPAAPTAITVPEALVDLNAKDLEGVFSHGALIGECEDAGSLGLTWNGGDGQINQNQRKPVFIKDFAPNFSVIRFNGKNFLRLVESGSPLSFIHTTKTFHAFFVVGNLRVETTNLTGRYTHFVGNAAGAGRKGWSILYRENGVAGAITSTTTNLAASSGRSTLKCLPGSWHVVEVWADGSTLRISLDGGTAQSFALTGTVTGDGFFDTVIGNYMWATASTPGCFHLRRFLLYDAVQADRAAIIAALRTEIDRARMPRNLLVLAGDSIIAGNGGGEDVASFVQAHFAKMHSGLVSVAGWGTPAQMAGGGPLSSNPDLDTVMSSAYVLNYDPTQITGRRIISNQIGINDITNGRTLGAIQASLASINAKQEAGGWEVWNHTIAPAGGYYSDNEAGHAKEAIRSAYNEWIREGAGGSIPILLDTDELATGELTPIPALKTLYQPNTSVGRDEADWIDPDYLHPNDFLYEDQAPLIVEALDFNATLIPFDPTAAEVIPLPPALDPEDASIVGALEFRGEPEESFTDTGATTPCTTLGDPVKGWEDATRGVILTQATTGNAPTFEPDAVQVGETLRPLHRFTASALQYLDGTTGLLSFFAGNDLPFSAYFVLEWNANTNVARTLLSAAKSDSNNNLPSVWMHVTTAGPRHSRSDTGSTLSDFADPNTIPTSGLCVVAVIFTGTGGNIWCGDAEGVRPLTGGNDLNVGTLATVNNVTYGALRRQVTGTPTILSPGDERRGSMYFYSDDHDDDTVKGLLVYLMEQWGIVPTAGG